MLDCVEQKTQIYFRFFWASLTCNLCSSEWDRLGNWFILVDQPEMALDDRCIAHEACCTQSPSFTVRPILSLMHPSILTRGFFGPVISANFFCPGEFKVF